MLVGNECFFILYTNLADLNAFANFVLFGLWVLFIIWEIISQGPIKPCTFSHRSQVIPASVMLHCACLSSKALYPWTTNRWVCGLHVRFSENFFKTQGQNVRIIIQQLLNNKTIKGLRPWFFCVSTFPEIEEYKIIVSHEHLTKKLRNCIFCHQKWGVDLYMGLTYTWVNTVRWAHPHNIVNG